MRAPVLALLLFGQLALLAQTSDAKTSDALTSTAQIDSVSAQVTPLQSTSLQVGPLETVSPQIALEQTAPAQSASSQVITMQLTPLQSTSSQSSTTQSSTSQSSTGQSSTGQAAGSSSGTSAPGQQPGSGQQSAQPTGPQPVPYSPDEFPRWARDLRRGEVITVGAFPITLLFSSLTYQLVRYAQNHFAAAYAPAIFGATATPLTNQEKIGVLLGGAGLAVVVALIDFTLGKVQGSS